MKFFPPPGLSACQVSLMSGHTVVIDEEGTELDPMFISEAVAKGCVPEGAQGAQPVEGDTPDFNRADRIRDVIDSMLDGNDPEAFNADGRPNLNTVSALAGFRATREEVNAIWDRITESNSGSGAA